jgi:hypothetical protein
MHRVFDATGMVLSTLCIIHCTLLPIISVALPFVALFQQAEWVHPVFVALAAPAALIAIAPTFTAPPFPWWIPISAALGLGALIAALFAEAESTETVLTVIGGLLLASAHLLNWRRAHA